MDHRVRRQQVPDHHHEGEGEGGQQCVPEVPQKAFSALAEEGVSKGQQCVSAGRRKVPYIEVDMHVLEHGGSQLLAGVHVASWKPGSQPSWLWHLVAHVEARQQQAPHQHGVSREGNQERVEVYGQGLHHQGVRALPVKTGESSGGRRGLPVSLKSEK